MTVSLFEKYGGFATVNTIVLDFYDRVLASDLARFFVGTDMNRLLTHQTQFFCKALGGPGEYKGSTLRAAHRGLNISDDDYDLVALLLDETLDEAGIEPGDRTAVAEIVEGLRADIVRAVG
ncbi:MAG: group I truncated hemoglobin [Nannocystales bacterium]